MKMVCGERFLVLMLGNTVEEPLVNSFTNAGTSGWSALISWRHHRELRWTQLYGLPVSPCMMIMKIMKTFITKSYFSLEQSLTHTHTHTPLWIYRSMSGDLQLNLTLLPKDSMRSLIPGDSSRDLHSFTTSVWVGQHYKFLTSCFLASFAVMLVKLVSGGKPHESPLISNQVWWFKGPKTRTKFKRKPHTRGNHLNFEEFRVSFF